MNVVKKERMHQKSELQSIEIIRNLFQEMCQEMHGAERQQDWLLFIVVTAWALKAWRATPLISTGA